MVPPTGPCALRSTQPLKVSTRDFAWGKGGRCFWLTTYHPCSAETSRKSGALTYPEPLGPPRPVAGHLYFSLEFNIKNRKKLNTMTICIIIRIKQLNIKQKLVMNMVDIIFCIVSNKREAGNNPESVWLLQRTKESVAPAGNRAVLKNICGKRGCKRHQKRTVIQVFGRRRVT